MRTLFSVTRTTLLMCTVLTCTLAFSALATAAEPLSLALNWKAEPEFGGFYAAQAHGYFTQRHLDVKITEGGSGTPTVQMLASRKVDYAIVSADEIAIAYDRGAKNIVALYASYQTNPQGIMTHAKRDFHSIADVLRSPGILLWQAGLPYAQYLTKKYGPLKVTTAPDIGGIGSFEHDPMLSQQCFVTSEPLQAKKAGLVVKTFLVADSGYNSYTAVLATTRQRLKQHPDEVKRMVAAVREGWQNYLKDPGPTNEDMMKLNRGMDAATFAAVAKAQEKLIRTPKGTPLGSMTEARWQTLVGQLQDIHAIDAPIKATDLYINL